MFIMLVIVVLGNGSLLLGLKYSQVCNVLSHVLAGWLKPVVVSPQSTKDSMNMVSQLVQIVAQMALEIPMRIILR